MLGRLCRFVFVIATLAVMIIQIPAPVTGQLAWFPTVVDQGPSLGTHTSLAIDGQGRAHISYLDEGNATLKYATQVNGGSWRVQTVDRPFFVVGATSLALDAADRPHIAYADGSRLRYASWDGWQWNVSIVDLTYSDGTDSLAIGRDGFPRIAYAWDTGTLRFARWDGRAWIRETVETTTFVARYASIALDLIDRAYISYSGNGNLRYASEGDAGWSTEVVDPHSDTGSFSRLALDARGWPRIAYQDHAHAALRLAAWDGFARQWTYDTIDSGGDPGWDVGFALDGDGSPHISYYERLSANLRYARKIGSVWERETVDSVGTVGWYTSLAVNGSGMPAISYYDPTRDALRFASGAIAFQVRTDSAESVRMDRAILRGDLMCLGGFSSANVSFDWRSLGSGTWNHTASVELKDPSTQRLALANLTPNSTYEYRIVGTTPQETVYGEAVQFRTATTPPPPEPPYLLLGLTATVAVAAILVARFAWRRRVGREALRRKMTRDEMLRP